MFDKSLVCFHLVHFFLFITVIKRKCRPPKINTLGHIRVRLSPVVKVFSFCLCGSTPLSTFLLHKLHLSSWKPIISIGFELSLSSCERLLRAWLIGQGPKSGHRQHVFVCVISYLLLWCCCKCWRVAPSAGQAVWRRPSPAGAPALCPGGWLTCSPSVCPGQCHCVLYLKVSINGVKFDAAVYISYSTIMDKNNNFFYVPTLYDFNSRISTA